MAWINIEVIGSGEKVKDIDSVRICTNNNNEVLLFETKEDADLWCMKNHKPKALYSHIEVWG